MAGYKLKDLRSAPQEKLIHAHDMAGGTVESPELIRQKLARRDAQAQGDQIEKLTRLMVGLTVAITVMTLLNLVATVVLAIKA